MSLLKTLMAENSSMFCTWNDLNLDWIHHDQTSCPPFPTNQKDVYHSNLQFKPAFSQSCRIAVSNEELLTSCFQGIFQIFHTLHPEATPNSSSLRKATNSRFAKPKLLDHVQMYNWQTWAFEQVSTKRKTNNGHNIHPNNSPWDHRFFLTSVKVRGVSKCARAKASWSCSRRSDILCHTTLTRGFAPCAVNVTWAFDAALLDVKRPKRGINKTLNIPTWKKVLPKQDSGGQTRLWHLAFSKGKETKLIDHSF